jgi:hypothetical protein
MNRRQLLGGAVALAITEMINPKGTVAKEKKPKGYGTDVCVTMLHDMATSSQAYSDRDFDFRLNLVGCDAPWETLDGKMNYQPEACPTAARKAGNKLIKKGLPTSKINPKVIGAMIGGEGRVVDGVDCTLFEDWSWG